MREPAVLRCAMPVLHAIMGDDEIARMQLARRLALFLIPALAAGDQQQLEAIVVNVPVVPAAGLEGDVADADVDRRVADQGVEVALADKILGVGVVRGAHGEDAVLYGLLVGCHG